MTAQQEFLSFPKGRHDDIMDGIWTALDGHKPCRHKKMSATDKDTERIRFIDWMTI